METEHEQAKYLQNINKIMYHLRQKIIDKSYKTGDIPGVIGKTK